MKATVVVDNNGAQGLEGEWGLCIYVEYEGKKILLDAGASGLFVKNAEGLGISLEDIDFAVLSHAHFDHGNGMREFFEANRKAKFYLREGSGENCYKKVFRAVKYIGIPRGILEEYGDRIVFAEGDYRIMDGVRLIPHDGPVPRRIGRSDHLYIRQDGHLRPDDFRHEQSLVFEVPDGIVVFNSCSHGGADRIIREAQDAYPGKKVLGMIGGFHLFNRTDDEVRSFAARLKDAGAQYIYTGHCTGERGYQILSEELGDMVRPLFVGQTMEF